MRPVRPTAAGGRDDLEHRATTGDPVAFGSLLRRWDHDLRGVAWAVTRDQHAIDDVMQDAYERAFRGLASFDGRSSLKTWLHTIVHRTAIDRSRYEGRRRHDDIDDPAITVPETVSTATDRSALDRLEVDDMLGSLPSDQRVALMLTVGIGFTYDEAAEVTGDSRGTIASRVNRARRRLQQWEVGTA